MHSLMILLLPWTVSYLPLNFQVCYWWDKGKLLLFFFYKLILHISYLLNSWSTLKLNAGVYNLFLKGHIVNILGFIGHNILSIATTLPSWCESDHKQYKYEWAEPCSSKILFTKNRQWAGFDPDLMHRTHPGGWHYSSPCHRGQAWSGISMMPITIVMSYGIW